MIERHPPSWQERLACVSSPRDPSGDNFAFSQKSQCPPLPEVSSNECRLAEDGFERYAAARLEYFMVNGELTGGDRLCTCAPEMTRIRKKVP
jgi:hypothetical protein